MAEVVVNFEHLDDVGTWCVRLPSLRCLLNSTKPKWQLNALSVQFQQFSAKSSGLG